MIKLIVLVALALLAFRGLSGRWPWELGKTPRRLADKARARALLGVRDEDSREAIIEAHRRLLAQVHPDRGGSNEQVHEANAARDLLLGELMRKQTERS